VNESVAVPFAYGQIQGSLTFQTPTTTTGAFNGLAYVNYSGAGVSSVNCSFVSNFPINAGPGSIYGPGCAPFTTQSTRYDCVLSAFNASSNTNDLLFFNGTIIPSSQCAGTIFSISYNCSNSVSRITRNITSLLTTSDLTVGLTTDAVIGNVTTENETIYDVPVFDKGDLNKTLLIAYATVSNKGACAATGVSCELTIPDVVPPDNLDIGFVNFVAENSTIRDLGCSLVASTITCPFDIIPTGQNITIQAAVNLAHNGLLEYKWNCTATGLVNPLTAYTETSVYGINVPDFVANSSSFSFSSSSSLIINTVIPLSVFGGTMLIIFCVIGLSIGIYLLVKKVVLAEENVGF